MAEVLRDASPDGVFCCSDALAIGALAAIAAAGRRAPDDVAVVGYDDVAQAAVTVPPLTTVAQPIEHKGELTARALLSALAAENSDLPPDSPAEPPKRTILPTELLVRGTTAPPPD
jgi:DNA-binding LacI/PurR family transcriptional regulator